MTMDNTIPQAEGNMVSDIMAQQKDAQEAELKEIISFYLTSYPYVELVRCLRCGADLCLWIMDKDSVAANAHVHHKGLRRIELGDDLLATRKRHDGVMGYLCKCGNNNQLSEIERGIVPQSNVAIPADQPHIQAMVQKRMLAEGYKPNIEYVEGKVITDEFETEVLKNG